MKVTQRVRKILSWYESDNPGTKTNLARILMTGKLAGTGKMVILPVDQGWEHGPARSFAPNPPAYDPHYFPQLAIDAGLNAYAAPLGQIEAAADSYAGSVPLILKMNSSNSHATSKDQAITASVGDALRLGCAAVGFTIYPGSDDAFEMIEEIREISEEAKAFGLATVIWSYPRGGNLSREGETDIDVTVKENSLTVSGNVEKAEKAGAQTYLHRGIAARALERKFDLADHIIVTGAEMVNGLLHIDLVREVPEEKKPRKISIGTSVGTPTIEQKAA